MARGQAFNASAQESGSGGVRDRLTGAILAQYQDPRFGQPIQAPEVPPLILNGTNVSSPLDPLPNRATFSDRFSAADENPYGAAGSLPLDPGFSNPGIPPGYGPNTFNPNGPGGYPSGVFTPTGGNVPLPQSRPAGSVLAPSPARPAQVQQRPASPQPQQPSMIDSFNPFSRVGAINPIPGPTSNFFGAQSGTSPSGDYGSQFRGEMPQNRTVGANYNGPLLNQSGQPRFGGRGGY
jgi:hypothetical protein